ncbi:hypothetical protein [Burkholderia perseverans]|uniref:hypothetical protein n=1 Tax=Burkholderia perseverans TaxID=2615214 RepID=UPI001FEF8C95|nr:hypothetical protein [Burkholderia perseverans]
MEPTPRDFCAALLFEVSVLMSRMRRVFGIAEEGGRDRLVRGGVGRRSDDADGDAIVRRQAPWMARRAFA